jgi:hypothetical protein
MSSLTVTTKESNDSPLPSTGYNSTLKKAEQLPTTPNSTLNNESSGSSDVEHSSQDSMGGHLASIGGFLSSSALALVKRSGDAAASLATSTSSAITNGASNVVDSAMSLTQHAAASVLSAGNQGATLASNALDKAFSTGEVLLEAGIGISSYVTSEAITSAVSSTQWLYHTSISTGEYSVGILADQFLGLIENAGGLLSQHIAAPIGGTVVSAFDTLAGDSTAPASVHMRAARAVAGFLPITGGAKDIGKAREMYRCAQALPPGDEREAKLHQARRDCLIATASLSLDVISYFATGGAAQAIRTGSTALSALTIAKGAKENTTVSRWLPQINIDILTPQADIALSSPTIREAMEIILRHDPKQQQ